MAGDPRDAQVYAAHAPDLMRLATYLVGPADAPDVVSAAVVRALASPRWRTIRNHGGYLSRAVQNEARRMRTADARRGARERRVFHDETTRTRPDGESDSDVIAHVRALSNRQQLVILLTYWDDLPPEVVGQRLGMSEGSVKRHLARARARLRSDLDGT